jgi:glucose-6-phosphate isomerase
MADGAELVRLDAANAWAEAVGDSHGLRRAEVDGLAGRVADYHGLIEARRGRDLGFMELPYERDVLGAVKARAAELRGWCRDFVVLGIGGSALGNIAIHGALNHPFHNLLPAGHPARLGAPRITVLSNVDPALVSAFLDLTGDGLESTAFNVITKSGSTAETMSQFLFIRDLIRRRGGDPARQIVVTTDPDPCKSPLRRIAQEEGYAALPVPPNVGGRFSVLSAVGLLSAAVGGLDVDAMLDGAAAMDSRCRARGLWENPAALYAAVLHLFYRKGKPITVLMPYCSALARLADWYCQLWAESLGKRDGLTARDVFLGPTPVGALGVTDQHSVMQLYQDGPFDKVITLVEVERLVPEGDLRICQGKCEPELAHLARHTFGELFQAELAATRRALTDKQRPNLTLQVPEVSEATLGALFMFFQYAVAYSGYLYGVNAFDQPGVQLGKTYTDELMGRKG